MACTFAYLYVYIAEYLNSKPARRLQQEMRVLYSHWYTPRQSVSVGPPFMPRSTRDTTVPNNISKYNYKDRTYKVDPPGPGDHLAMHLAIDGWALFREGDEAKLQAAAEEKKKAAADEARKAAQKQVFMKR